ncbi:hypothetical protein RRG08_051260 [Elysia crispata]|uniref:Uncharacterized protein n=1 Tax=Elysia crispata TaxID=231223 RepID=A0AAE1A7L6_9GAST|nr:hypothetical protein RRG08_051260 [Elysia crispata]
MAALQFVIFGILSFVLAGSSANVFGHDKCGRNAHTVIGAAVRIPNVPLPPGVHRDALCDIPSTTRPGDHVQMEGWYRFKNVPDDGITGSCVPERRCGTVNTLWRNSSLPAQHNGQLVKICLNREGNCCQDSFNVWAYNCGRYYVYYLRGVKFCPVAYCIGPLHSPTTKQPTTSTTTTTTTTTTTKPTTMPTTSTSTPTTSTSKSTTTKPTTTVPTTNIPGTTVPMKPIVDRNCHVCQATGCSALELIYSIPKPCPQGLSFCMTDVVQRSGQRQIFKRCVDQLTCHHEWYDESSDDSKCQSYNSRDPRLQDLHCHFCCEGDACKTKIKPETRTLYTLPTAP